MRQALLRAYRRLPESVRYSLRPVNAVEEAASFLPSGPRLALLELVRAYRSATAAAHHRGELALLEGVSRVDGAALRVASDLAGDAAAYWSGLLFEGVPGRRVVGEVRGPLGFARVALPDADLTLLRLNRLVRRRARARGSARAHAILAAHPLIAEDDDGFVAVTSGDPGVLHASFGLSGVAHPRPKRLVDAPLRIRRVAVVGR